MADKRLGIQAGKLLFTAENATTGMSVALTSLVT